MDAIPHAVERATISNMNVVAKSIAIVCFVYPFLPNPLGPSCYPYMNTILFYRSFSRSQFPVFLISECKVNNCYRTQQIFMQLYSIFTHSFDLGQVIDF